MNATPSSAGFIEWLDADDLPLSTAARRRPIIGYTWRTAAAEIHCSAPSSKLSKLSWRRSSRGWSVEGFVESGMTGAFRVSLVHGAEEIVLSPYELRGHAWS